MKEMSYAIPYETSSKKTLDFAQKVTSLKNTWIAKHESDMGLDHNIQFDTFAFSFIEKMSDACDNSIVVMYPGQEYPAIDEFESCLDFDVPSAMQNSFEFEGMT